MVLMPPVTARCQQSPAERGIEDKGLDNQGVDGGDQGSLKNGWWRNAGLIWMVKHHRIAMKCLGV